MAKGKKKKYGDLVRKHVANPRHIRGIFNYCDRWCERCPMTLRCSVFAISREQFPDAGARDENDERFWEKLSDVFQGTIEMIREDAERQGIDLDPCDTEAVVAEHRRRERAVKEHECPRAAKRYADMVDEWFDSAEPLFEEKRVSLESQARMGLPGADPSGEAARLKDAVEVARYYQYQIQVKLMRAADSLLEEESETLLKEYLKDSDGSAKVALIGIDRSIPAWAELRLQFPECGDAILDILVQLDRLRQKTGKAFPSARAFVRPGFDDGPMRRK
jgi:hypothetical protein